MTYPPGATLIAEFDFLKDGVLADPSPLPTIILAYKSDGSTIAPPSLEHTATGRFRAIVFNAIDTVDGGEYVAIASTSDVTMDYQAALQSWEVGTEVVDPATVAAAVWNRLTSLVVTSGSMGKYMLDSFATVLAKVGLIGNGVVFSPVPVGAGGKTIVTRGSSYLKVDGLSLKYTIAGYPPLTVDANAYWRAFKLDGTTLVVTGKCIAVDQMEFELTAAQTTVLYSGVYSLSTTLITTSFIKMPNDNLIVEESV